MLTIAETRDEVRVVDDQHGRPTSCIDLSGEIARLIEGFDSEEQASGIVHITGSSDFPSINSKIKMKNSITWADFAEEIFAKYRKTTKVVRVPSSLYPTKAKRPEWSILL